MDRPIDTPPTGRNAVQAGAKHFMRKPMSFSPIVALPVSVPTAGAA